MAGSAEPRLSYDAVLIDEAQDMPHSFFKLVRGAAREPKRVIWAYDDLQKLSDIGVPSLGEMFGTNDDEDPLVWLVNENWRPKEDINLQLCYRNPPQALTLAHALGMGIYREQGGLIQHFDMPDRWLEVGYSLVNGRLEAGQEVTLRRSENSYPEYFDELLQSDDIILTESFRTPIQQAEWIASSIETNLNEDQLEHDDILIVLPDPRTSRSTANLIIDALNRRRIPAHLVGVSAGTDEIFQSNSVALAHIYRSKGNEAAMVYIADSHLCYSGPNIVKLRNTLFTAITRSRAWVRLTGFGRHMEELQREIQRVVDNGYSLRFIIPDAQQLEEIRQIYRERTAAEEQRTERVLRGAEDFAAALERGELNFEELPPRVRSILARYTSAQREFEIDNN